MHVQCSCTAPPLHKTLPRLPRNGSPTVTRSLFVQLTTHQVCARGIGTGESCTHDSLPTCVRGGRPLGTPVTEPASAAPQLHAPGFCPRTCRPACLNIAHRRPQQAKLRPQSPVGQRCCSGCVRSHARSRGGGRLCAAHARPTMHRPPARLPRLCTRASHPDDAAHAQR